MHNHNPKNERTKRYYTEYMKLTGGKSESSIDKPLAAIARFETSTRWKGFEKFHIEQAIAFRDGLDPEVNEAAGKPLAKGTIVAILKAVRAFFIWLADQPSFRRRIRYSGANYFNPSNRDDRIARSAEQKPSPSLEQVRRVLKEMPANTLVERRNRAIVAFLILTGIRDGAAIGLKLRHVALGKAQTAEVSAFRPALAQFPRRRYGLLQAGDLVACVQTQAEHVGPGIREPYHKPRRVVPAAPPGGLGPGHVAQDARLFRAVEPQPGGDGLKEPVIGPRQHLAVVPGHA